MARKSLLRKSGVHFLGEMPWGAHLCQFYHQKQDLFEIVIPFLAAGLEEKEYCLWLVPAVIEVSEATKTLEARIPNLKHHLRKKQLTLMASTHWYLEGGAPDEKQLLKRVLDKGREAISQNWAGFRAVGGLHQIERDHWKGFLDYEERVHDVVPRHKFLALCTYSLPNCPLLNIPKIIGCHHKTFLKKGWGWEVVQGDVA